MATIGAEVEYRVRPVTRYIVTKFERDQVCTIGSMGRSIGRGEYSNADTAYEVAYALAKADAERLGCGPGDMRVIYPQHPNEITAVRSPKGIA